MQSNVHHSIYIFHSISLLPHCTMWHFTIMTLFNQGMFSIYSLKCFPIMAKITLALFYFLLFIYMSILHFISVVSISHLEPILFNLYQNNQFLMWLCTLWPSFMKSIQQSSIHKARYGCIFILNLTATLLSSNSLMSQKFNNIISVEFNLICAL